MCGLARSLVLTVGPFFVVVLATTARGTAAAGRTFLPLTVAFAVPLVCAGPLLLGYNQARFGSPFEDGVRVQLATGANPRFERDYDAHGMVSVAYVGRNTYHSFVNP